MSPPITAMAMGARCSAPSPILSAVGSIPNTMAAVVMMMGRSRTGPAFISASSRLIPPVSEGNGIVDQQDGVLGHKAHQHNNADKAENADPFAGDEEQAHCADKTDREENMMVKGCTKLSNCAARII